jgi:hypothetical protein
MASQSSILSFFGRASSFPPNKRHKCSASSSSTVALGEAEVPEARTSSDTAATQHHNCQSDSDSETTHSSGSLVARRVVTDQVDAYGRSSELRDFDITSITSRSTRVYTAPTRRPSTAQQQANRTPSHSPTRCSSSNPTSPTRSPSKTNNTNGNGIGLRSPVKRKLEQMFLDFGQKNLESITCRECGMMYAPGVESDEQLHKQFHSSIANAMTIPVCLCRPHCQATELCWY